MVSCRDFMHFFNVLFHRELWFLLKACLNLFVFLRMLRPVVSSVSLYCVQLSVS